MPFVPADIPKCPKCNKSVYAAEERVAGGKKWHKQCFKCGMCNKMLDSTNSNEHENELYCRICHARKYGPKGYGFGGGAGALSMDTGAQFGNTESVSNAASTDFTKNIAQAPEGEGCPRCGGRVYAAEQMLARGRVYHKSCYKCKACTKHLDSTNTCEGPDNEIYCKVDYGKKFGPKGYGYGQGGGCLQSDASIVSSDRNRPTINTSVIQAAEGEGCPRCGGVVYAAEQMMGRGTVWHKTCFNCRECHRVLDSVLACDGPDRDVYCKLCYAKKFGPKGYGFGCGSAFLMCESIPSGDTPKLYDTKSIQAPEGQGCPRCGGMVFAAEQMLSKGREWHKLCFNCNDCKRPLDSVLACDGPDKEIYCKTCYGKRYGPKGFGYGHMPTLVSVGFANGDLPGADVPTEAKLGIKAPEGEGCPRCGYYAYAAEQMPAKNKMWHKRCFNCADCHRSLDSTNLNDAPDNEIYCVGCYRKKFGPHGVGYGMGAGCLATY